MGFFAWIFVFYIVSGCGWGCVVGSSSVGCSGCVIGCCSGSSSCGRGCIGCSCCSRRSSSSRVISCIFWIIWLIWGSWGLKFDCGLVRETRFDGYMWIWWNIAWWFPFCVNWWSKLNRMIRYNRSCFINWRWFDTWRLNRENCMI